MKRREFVTVLGGAVAWPLAARAQQRERMRRIGVLLARDENDPAAKREFSAFTQALAGLGWTDGRNVRIVRRSYWRRPETTYRRSMRILTMPETAGCFRTDSTR
jgi:hypothetical protein